MTRKSCVSLLLASVLIGFSVTSAVLGLQSPEKIFSYGTITYGWLHTDGRWIKDDVGNTVWLLGVGRHEMWWAFDVNHRNPDGTYWYKIHEVESQYELLKNYTSGRVNLVRVGLNSYHWRTNPSMPDVDGNVKSYRQYCDDIVDWCSKRGMYVILSWFADTDDQNTWTMTKKQKVLAGGSLHDFFIQFWNEVSARYADIPNALFDPINEPYFRDKAAVTDLLIEVITVIRNNAPDNIIAVGHPDTLRNMFSSGYFPLPFNNLIYGYHDYYRGYWQGYPQGYEEYYINGDFETAKIEYEKVLDEWLFSIQRDYNVPTMMDETGYWYKPDEYINHDKQMWDFYEIMREHQTGFVQWCWSGCWSAAQDDSRDIDYHVLKSDWQTLTVIGELFRDWITGM